MCLRPHGNLVSGASYTCTHTSFLLFSMAFPASIHCTEFTGLISQRRWHFTTAKFTLWGSSLHSFFQENNCSAFLFQESREVSSQCRLAVSSRERLGAEAGAGALSKAELRSLGNQYWSRAIVDMIRLGWSSHFYCHPPPCITKKWFHLQGNPFSCKCPQPLSSLKAESMSWVLEIVDLSEWEAEAWTHRCPAITGQPPSSPKYGTQHCIWNIARYVSQHLSSATDGISQ